LKSSNNGRLLDRASASAALTSWFHAIDDSLLSSFNRAAAFSRQHDFATV
jgi:hypothetical protein